MRLLSIGNSFSQNAHHWLHEIAREKGDEIDTFNLYIGGCSLEKHWKGVFSGLEYDLEGNGGEKLGRSTVADALDREPFDVITLQQCSSLSGRPQTYLPYLPNLAAMVKGNQRKAKILFHKTWSYDVGTESDAFHAYNDDQQEMFRRISDAARMASKLINAEIIPAGDAVQAVRDNVKAFDMAQGGLSLCRDGKHLTATYGQFTAAAAWYRALTGNMADGEKFAAEHPEFDPALVRAILEQVAGVFAG